MKRILITAATEPELRILREWLEDNWSKKSPEEYQNAGTTAELLVTGVGPVLTAFSLGKRSAEDNPDLAIQMGIAGAFDRALPLGTVVQLRADRFANWGARDANETAISVFELGLVPLNEIPFQDGWLLNPNRALDMFPEVSGITVMETTGTAAATQELEALYGAKLETMESASFTYSCLMLGWPFHCLRSISNYVGPRDRDAWEIELALKTVNQAVIDLLKGFA